MSLVANLKAFNKITSDKANEKNRNNAILNMQNKQKTQEKNANINQFKSKYNVTRMDHKINQNVFLKKNIEKVSKKQKIKEKKEIQEKVHNSKLKTKTLEKLDKKQKKVKETNLSFLKLLRQKSKLNPKVLKNLTNQKDDSDDDE